MTSLSPYIDPITQKQKRDLQLERIADQLERIADKLEGRINVITEKKIG